MAVQSIRLLGTFEVLRGGQPLTATDWRNQQTRTILKLLLTRRGRVVPADQLLELLWPEADPDTGRRSLHVRISQLRRALDPDNPDAYILTVEGGYVFNPEADCRIDVIDFEAHAQWGRRCQENSDLAEAITAYETARSLYRGDLLEEDLYEDWAFAERERLRECFLTLLIELAECYARQGHYRRAVTRCREVLAADSCRESVYVRLMLYHYYAGERDLALRVYEHCRQVLSDELGVEPLPQTTALYEQILQRQVAPVDGAVHYPQPVYEGRLFEVPYSLGRTPFVGREQEYAWLVERLREAAAGGGGMTAVAGEAGLGKTRLAEQALGYLQEHGFRILSSRCYEVEAHVPYQPVVEALRPLATGDLALSPEDVAELARLFPSLRHPAGQRAPAGEEQHRLFEAVSRLLAEAVGQPTAILVDDVQWADAASLALLGHLARRAIGLPVAWLITYRPEEASPTHPLHALFDGLRRDEWLAAMRLTPLSPDAVAALVDQMSGEASMAASLGARLAQESGGNPFYLVSILQNLFEEGILSVAADGTWTLSRDLVAGASDLMLPPTLRQMLERRLNQLEREARRVLEAAAVLGHQFDFDLLERVTGMSEAALLDALDRLAENRLLEEQASSTALGYDFSHDKLREVTYQCIHAARRRQLHRRAAEALADLHGDDPAASAELTYHYRRGGRAAEAVLTGVRAGEYALRLYALSRALDYFSDALHQAEEAGVTLDDEQLAALHIGWGDALRRSGRYDEALPHYIAALPLAQGEQKQTAAYHIGSLEAIRHGSLAEFNRMAPLLERELGGMGDSWALAGLRWSQAYIATIQGDASRARACCCEGWRVARRLLARGESMPPALAVTAYGGIARGYGWWAEWGRAMRYADKALALATVTNDLNGVAGACIALGAALYGLGRWDEALRHLERGYSLAADAGDPRMQGEALYGAALMHLERGDWTVVEEHARRILAAAEPTGDVLRQGFGHFLLACVTIRRGTPHEAIPPLQSMLQTARWSEALIYVVFTLRLLAEAHLLAGEPEQAITIAREGIELAGRTRQRRERGSLLRILGAALAQSGELSQAEGHLREADALAERIGCRYDLAQARCSLGKFHRENGAADLACECFTTALALFEGLGAVHDAAVTRQLLAR
jgi:DNA-binding SARP family transcriptional activator